MTLFENLKQTVSGQDEALRQISAYVAVARNNLSELNRPLATFMLMGPTGVGKTRTVEALATALHGTTKKMIKIDCAEFSHGHEVAKLKGSPPGYLGHRETSARFTQSKVDAVQSDGAKIALILFDEIEKGADELFELMLGILDRATMTTGSNEAVDFSRAMIFMTSNLGVAKRMNIGFESKLKNIVNPKNTLRKKFSAEFVNRVDCVIEYAPLSRRVSEQLLDSEVARVKNAMLVRLGARAFDLVVSDGALSKLHEECFSVEFGARELKRVVTRRITMPIALMLEADQIVAGSTVTLMEDFTFKVAVSSIEDLLALSLRAVAERKKII